MNPESRIDRDTVVRYYSGHDRMYVVVEPAPLPACRDTVVPGTGVPP